MGAQEKGIVLFEGRSVTGVEEGRLLLDGRAGAEPFDECLWCTQAAPPAWLAATGLPLGARMRLIWLFHSLGTLLTNKCSSQCFNVMGPCCVSH